MPRIPTQQRQVRPSMVEGARVSPEGMTKDLGALAGLGQAISQAGQLGMQFAAKLEEARATTEYNNGVTTMNKAYNILEESLKNDPDYTTYEKQFEDAQKDITKLRQGFTIPAALEKWETTFVKMSEIRRHKIMGMKNVREILKMQGDLETNLIDAEKTGDLGRALSILKMGEATGIIDPKPAAIRREQIKQNIDIYRASTLIMKDPEMAIEAIQDKAIFPNLLDKTRLSLSKRAEIALNTKKAKNKKNLEIQQTKTQNDFIHRVYDTENPLIWGEVDQSNLNPTGSGSKAFFKNLIVKRDEAIIEEKNLPYTQTNGKTLADLMLLNTDPDKRPMTPAEILGYVPDPNGISLQAAKSLMATTNIQKTSVFKNTEASLKAQFGYEGIITGFGAKPLGALYYNNAMTEMLDNFARTPLKGIELRDKMYEIAKPYLEAFWATTGESQDDIDNRLKLMGIKQSPALKILK